MEGSEQLVAIKKFLNNRDSIINCIFSDYIEGYDMINSESLEFVFDSCKTSIRFKFNMNDSETTICDIVLDIVISMNNTHKSYDYVYDNIDIDYSDFKKCPFVYFNELKQYMDFLLDKFITVLDTNKCEQCGNSCLNFSEEGIIRYCSNCFHIENKIIDCPVCLISDENSGTIKMPCCRNDIHVTCIKEWLNSKHTNITCPLCRNNYDNHPYLLEKL